MSRKLILAFILLLLFIQAGLSQATEDPKKKADELKKEAVLFLRETAADVGTLRTLENRISFASEIAGLMWFQDEKEARAMFQNVIVDFRQLLIQADTQYTLAETMPGDDDSGGIFISDGQNSRAKVMQKFKKAIAVRQQITASIMEHDPQMAYDFFTNTSQAVANPKLRAQFEESDAVFEIKLANAIAETDVDKALEAGRKRLAKGASFELIGLMQKIYEKDADKGIKFGEEIVAKIKSGDAKSVNLYLLSMLLTTGSQSLDKIKEKPGKKPMFGESSMREIADLLGQELLKRDVSEDEITGYISQVERFAPSRAMQVRQKLKLKKTITTVRNDDDETVIDTVEDDDNVVVDAPQMETINRIPLETSGGFLSEAQKVSAQLSKEEKEKLVTQTRATVAKIKNREQKILVLSAFAAQMAQLGDKELAREMMNEARGLVNLPPKNYRDFIGVWMLAGGYAQADPDGAFPILEDAILRLNETLGAVIKIGEFIDVDEQFIEGGEVQVGAFGGAITREILGTLGMANPTLRSLAVADFARTRSLTNKFDRAEIRILAKMLVLRAVLGTKETKPIDIPIPAEEDKIIVPSRKP